MNIYHVVDKRTGVILFSAPDARAAHEVSTGSGYEGSAVMVTEADEQGRVGGKLWTEVFRDGATLPGPQRAAQGRRWTDTGNRTGPAARGEWWSR